VSTIVVRPTPDRETTTVDIIAAMWKPVIALVISSATVAALWPATLIGSLWAIEEFLVSPNSTGGLAGRFANTMTTYLPSFLGGAVSGLASLLVIRVIAGRERVKLLLIASGLVGGAIVVAYFVSEYPWNDDAAKLAATNVLPRVIIASALGFGGAVLAGSKMDSRRATAKTTNP